MKLSENNRRKINKFKSYKIGYYSFWLFTIFFIASLFAEFIANDKPIIISHQDKLYYPIFKQYTEQELGGDFYTEADYKDPYLQEIIINNGGWILWPPIKYNYQTINYNLSQPAPSPPSFENILGTDDQGRDVMARIIYGFRVAVLFGLSLTILSSIIGIVVGAIQGYFGGWLDLILQRFIEIWSGLPILYLLIIMASFIEPNFWYLLIIMLLFSWMSLVAFVRAEFFKIRKLDYVTAARAIGVSEIVIIFRHILPNAFVASITFIPFILSASLTTLTSLDFLGFGLPLGSPSLGELLAQGKNNIQASWLVLSGFIVLAVTLSMLIFIGEAVRNALDPNR
ncbi:MAG: ABC transporter permease [Pseudomonadota bacterium]